MLPVEVGVKFRLLAVVLVGFLEPPARVLYGRHCYDFHQGDTDGQDRQLLNILHNDYFGYGEQEDEIGLQSCRRPDEGGTCIDDVHPGYKNDEGTDDVREIKIMLEDEGEVFCEWEGL